jgi:Cd2+/Zn2+-exporting ATPase
MSFKALLKEYAIIFFISLGFVLHYFFKDDKVILLASVFGALPFLWHALMSLYRRKIDIHVFNMFAVTVAFITREINSAAFIVLMLTFAEILDRYNEFRSRRAVEELLKLKPLKAMREINGQTEEVGVDEIRENDIIVVPTGARIPVDGVVIFGRAFIDESLLTGESMPVEKIVGDRVLSSTLNETGAIKFKAVRVGSDSTIERMVALIKEASKNKSQPEKLADRFAKIFLPVVIILGVATYVLTKSISMTAAIFLVACADDMSVAIPLAVTASLGQAAKRGVIIKGGAWLDRLGKIKTLVLDKTGTLTYGKIDLKDFYIDPKFQEKDFWLLVGIAEKYSEHPAGRAIFKKSFAAAGEIPDPEQFSVQKGSGISASYKNQIVVIGNENIIKENNFTLSDIEKKTVLDWSRKYGETFSLVFIDKKFAGLLALSDIPRTEASLSLEQARMLGVEKIGMLTGDNENVAKNLSDGLKLDFYQSKINPEEKLEKIKSLIGAGRGGVVAMVGDGINDGPALAEADVSIAMGQGGTAVATEAADVVILTDDLSRIPEMIALGKKTMSVIRVDTAIWAISNIVGFVLVWTGYLDPVYAAAYNFITDFFPLLNSARLFRSRV